MLINYDEPIKQCSGDALDREGFANRLLEVIKSVDKKSTFTIGLFGSWGSGKTSVINMLEEKVDEHNHSSNGEKVCVIKFDPWNYLDDFQIVAQFFDVMQSSLSLGKNGQAQIELGKLLKSYAAIAPVLELAPTIGPFVTVSSPVAGFFGKRLIDKGAQKKNDLISIKNKICKALRKYPEKLLVIIDDLDRISNSQIQRVIQLVQAVAHFPNITYLIACDREIVANALGGVQGCNGDEYLEKIIQLPICLPELNQDQLVQALNVQFEDIANLHDDHKPLTDDQHYWERVFWGCIFPRVKNIRDVRRLSNAIAVLYEVIGNDVCFADIAVLASLQTWDPALYRWIFNNRDSLCGVPTHGLGFGQNSYLAEKKDHYEELFREVKDPNEKITTLRKNILSIVFPAVASLNGIATAAGSLDELRVQGRIAHKDCCMLAFAQGHSLAFLHVADCEEVLTSFSEERAVDAIIGYKSLGQLSQFVSILNARADSLGVDRRAVLSAAILRAVGSIDIDDAGFFAISPARSLLYAVEGMLHSVGQEKADYVVKNALDSFDEENLFGLAGFLIGQERAYGRIGEGNDNHEKQLLTADGLSQIESTYLSMLKQLSMKENLLEDDGAEMALLIWREIDGESYWPYFDRCLASSDKAIVHYAVQRMGTWQSLLSDGDHGWARYDLTDEHLPNDDLLQAIIEYRQSNAFWAESPTFHEKTAALFLQLVSEDDSKASSLEARKELSKWMAQYGRQKD